MTARWLLAAALALGCGDTAAARRAGLLGACTFNDECASPWICAAQRCRAPCRTDRDCANGWRCLSAGEPEKYVCYAPDDYANACAWDSHCRGGRVCGGDRVCRAQCLADYDCAVIAPGLRCLASGVCSAHPFLDGGALADVDLNLRDARPPSFNPDAFRDVATATDTAATAGTGSPTDTGSTTDAGSSARADEPTVIATTGCGPRTDPRACTPGTPGCRPVDFVDSREGASRCVRFSDGSVRCWGRSYAGVLGNGAIGTMCFTPYVAQRLQGASQLALGGGSGCAMFNRGVWCWGSNFQNNVGAGMGVAQRVPIPLNEAPDGMGTLAAGTGNTTCLVRPAGTLRCWGQNTGAELGVGDSAPRFSPVDVPITDVAQVAPGETHTCALRRDGTVWCWGANCAGQCGSAPRVPPSFPYPVNCSDRVTRPQQVMGITTARALILGRYFSCALLTDQRVLCWGWNEPGELGRGDVGSFSAEPMPVVGLSDAQALNGGDGFGACALRADRAVWCWGGTNRGATVPPMDRGRMTAVPGLTNVRLLSPGGTCAVRDDESVWCWGGLPGDGADRYTDPPRPVMF